MKNFNHRRVIAALIAVAFCLNASARWGYPNPMFPRDIPKAWNYDQCNYMTEIPAYTPLNKIAMVASHDAGMNEESYPYPTCAFSTQYATIYQQLNSGVRFLDLRVKKSQGAFWAYHGIAYGMSLKNMLDDVVRFLDDNPKETVLVELSHWQNEAEMVEAIGTILSNSKWTEKMFKDEPDSPLPQILNEVKLGQVRQKMIIIIDAPNPASEEPENALDHKLATKYGYTPEKGIWRFGALASNSKGKYGYFRLYDSYSNSSVFGDMVKDQKNKYHNYLVNNSKTIDSFLYCYQLTYNPGSGRFLEFSVGENAKKCNPYLDRELNNLVLDENGVYPNIVNLDYIDGRICNIVINQNLALLNIPAISYLNTTFSSKDNTVVEEYQFCKAYTKLTSESNNRRDLYNGWYVVEGSVEMAKGIKVMGEDVNIILKNGSHLTVKGNNDPGIIVDNSKVALHIYAQTNVKSTMGVLTATAPYHCAAIGGKEDHSGENIYIHGGNIEATGGDGAAAIGGGYAGGGENINIYGGYVTAKSSAGGAAIGGGVYNHGGGFGRHINIYGGEVEAKGSLNGAGIGGGNSGTGEYITIHGGVVRAEGGSAIGGGQNANGNHIEIWGGKVYANPYENSYAAGIGGGHGGSGESIQVKGGYVEIQGSKSGAGIGGGCYDRGGAAGKDITISGGTIVISGISNAHSIGSANDASSDGVKINGGAIWANSGKSIEKAKDDGGKQVYEVIVPDCGPDGTPVKFFGLSSSYGCQDMVSRGGEVKIWLPNGTHDFYTDERRYSVTVNGADGAKAKVESRAVDVSVTYLGYATLYSDKKLTIPEGVTVFAYLKSENGELIPVPLSKFAVLPANQGYVIKADKGVYHFFDTDLDASTIKSELKGVTKDTNTADFCPGQEKYGLGFVNGKAAFYKYTDSVLKGGKAYYVK